jgi:DNA polymerase III psi subunit
MKIYVVFSHFSGDKVQTDTILEGIFASLETAMSYVVYLDFERPQELVEDCRIWYSDKKESGGIRRMEITEHDLIYALDDMK